MPTKPTPHRHDTPKKDSDTDEDRGDVRGRLTPVDVVYYGVAVFLFGVFAGPIYTVLEQNAGSLGTGPAYLFQLVAPSLVLTILTVIYHTGASGGAR